VSRVGVRFWDGREVLYAGSKNIQTGTDQFLRILGPRKSDGTFDVIAEIPTKDIKEIFEEAVA
jgi:hypothetical protein